MMLLEFGWVWWGLRPGSLWEWRTRSESQRWFNKTRFKVSKFNTTLDDNNNTGVVIPRQLLWEQRPFLFRACGEKIQPILGSNGLELMLVPVEVVYFSKAPTSLNGQNRTKHNVPLKIKWNFIDPFGEIQAPHGHRRKMGLALKRRHDIKKADAEGVYKHAKSFLNVLKTVSCLISCILPLTSWEKLSVHSSASFFAIS